MISRRAFTQCVGLLGAEALLGWSKRAFAMTDEGNAWFMPDESKPHQRTWMAFGASEEIWGRTLLPEV